MIIPTPTQQTTMAHLSNRQTFRAVAIKARDKEIGGRAEDAGLILAPASTVVRPDLVRYPA